jgi:hypothetical protein
MSSPTIWVGFRLPTRKCSGTYETYCYSDQPVITIDPKFKNIKTLQDIEKNMGILPTDSPTDCYFSVDERTTIFYSDSQGCVEWALNENNSTVVIYGSNEIVAYNIPEFLTRISLEISIWLKSNKYCKRPYTHDEKKYIRHFPPTLDSIEEESEESEDSDYYHMGGDLINSINIDYLLVPVFGFILLVLFIGARDLS